MSTVRFQLGPSILPHLKRFLPRKKIQGKNISVYQPARKSAKMNLNQFSKTFHRREQGDNMIKRMISMQCIIRGKNSTLLKDYKKTKLVKLINFNINVSASLISRTKQNMNLMNKKKNVIRTEKFIQNSMEQT